MGLEIMLPVHEPFPLRRTNDGDHTLTVRDFAVIPAERTQNALRLKVARAEILRVQGVLRPW